jgi:hypothetical protein
MNSNKNASCRELFKILNILPYIYSILLFITKNKDQFFSNSHIHTVQLIQDTMTTCMYLLPTKRCLLLRNQDFQSSANNHKKSIR